MTIYRVSLEIELDGRDPHEAAKDFLMALVSADWSTGMYLAVADEDEDVVHDVHLTQREVMECLR